MSDTATLVRKEVLDRPPRTMKSAVSDTITFARKELLDLRRSKVVMLMLVSVAVAVIVSVIVASLDFRTQIGDYRAYVDTLRASGSTVIPAAPQIFPLQQLRAAMEYVELIGALFAIVLGYATIARERYRGTLDLMLVRPTRRSALGAGKLAGLATFWGLVVAGIAVLAMAAVIGVGTAAVTPVDWVRLLIACLAAWVYLVFWSAVAMGFTAVAKRPGVALIGLLALWLVVVLVIPQIGDTMDPDNQVPGGLFAALHIQKADEAAVLAHFSTYETARNALEVTSNEKLFERIAFAFLGIKAKYNQQSLSIVWADMAHYAVALLAMTAAVITLSVAATTRLSARRNRS